MSLKLKRLLVRKSKMIDKKPFWETKKLSEMTNEEWESLCDGCAKCCLNKLEDADTGYISYTNVACHQLDIKTCKCKNYKEREIYVPDCIKLTVNKLESLSWLPQTCAYRLLYEKKSLYPWHPLISGDKETVEKNGVSVKGRIISENNNIDLEKHIVDWPNE